MNFETPKKLFQSNIEQQSDEYEIVWVPVHGDNEWVEVDWS